MLRVFAVFALGMAVALIGGLCLPAMQARERAKLEFSGTQNTLKPAQEAIARIIPGLEAKMAWVREELNRTLLRLPGPDRADDAHVEIGKVFDQSGVDVEDRGPWRTARDEAKGLATFRREVTVSGSYPMIVRLLHGLMELPCTLSVDDLEIGFRPARPESGAKERVVANLTLTTYFSTEKTGEPAGAPPAFPATPRGATLEQPGAATASGAHAGSPGPAASDDEELDVVSDEELRLMLEDPLVAEQDRRERLGAKKNPFEPAVAPEGGKRKAPDDPAVAKGASPGARTDPITMALRLAGDKLAQLTADKSSSTRGWSYLVQSNYPPEPIAAGTGIPGFPGFERETTVLEVNPTDPSSPQPDSGCKRVTITVFWSARTERLELSTLLRRDR